MTLGMAGGQCDRKNQQGQLRRAYSGAFPRPAFHVMIVPPDWRHGDFDYLRILTEADIWSSVETKGGGNVATSVRRPGERDTF
jgi:hypothetical protein